MHGLNLCQSQFSMMIHCFTDSPDISWIFYCVLTGGQDSWSLPMGCAAMVLASTAAGAGRGAPGGTASVSSLPLSVGSQGSGASLKGAFTSVIRSNTLPHTLAHKYRLTTLQVTSS